MNESSINEARYRAIQLQEEAKHRWLVKNEIIFLLLHVHCLNWPILHQVQQLPTSGTLILYDTTHATEYKKDGWNWQKRKDNSGRIREDRAKLVLNRKTVVLGTYVHSLDTPTFHRRSYNLRDENTNIVLVHYFDEVNKNVTAQQAFLLSTLNCTEGRDLNQAIAEVPLHSPLSENLTFDAIMKDCLADECVQSLTPFSNSQTRITNEGYDRLSQFDDHGVLFSDQSTLLADSDLGVSNSKSCCSSTSLVEDTPSSNHSPVICISDFSPDWDFIDGGAKILICLESKLPASHLVRQIDGRIKNLYVQFGLDQRVPVEALSETVLRCCAPKGLFVGDVEMVVCITDKDSPQRSNRVTDLRWFSYREMPQSNINFSSKLKRTRSPLLDETWKEQNSIRINHQLNQADIDESIGFSFPNHVVSGSEKFNLASFVDSELNERQCKIRVVERLSDFHDVLYPSIQLKQNFSRYNERARKENSNPILPSSTIPISPISNYPAEPMDTTVGEAVNLVNLPPSENFVHNFSQATRNPQHLDASSTLPPLSLESRASGSPQNCTLILDDKNLEVLSDSELEHLSEKLLDKVVRQLVTIAHTSDELLEELNSLDESGLSLLHYVSFYNYAHLIPLLLSHGVHINQQSTQGQTPLHMAAGCGHREVIDVLLAANADLFAQDFDGFTPADRAEKSGYTEISIQLREIMQSELVFEYNSTSLPKSMIDEGRSLHCDADTSESNSSVRMTPSSHLARPFANIEGEMPIHNHREKCSIANGIQLHNRRLLLGAFSTMSLHDKCALSLGISRDRNVGNQRRKGTASSEENIMLDDNQGISPLVNTPEAYPTTKSAVTPLLMQATDTTSPRHKSSICYDGANNFGNFADEDMRDSEVQSVIADDEEGLSRLEAAMALMGAEERNSLEEEVKVLQHNIRAWLLRRNCKKMQETTKRLDEASKSFEICQQEEQERKTAREVTGHSMDLERAAVTVQAATRSMLARKNFLQTKNVAIKFQAATRGVLLRKQFARMKTHALASLVIQRNVKEWWHKQPITSSKLSESVHQGESTDQIKLRDIDEENNDL